MCLCACVLNGCRSPCGCGFQFRRRGAAGFELRSWRLSSGRFSLWSSRRFQFTSSPRSVTDSIRPRGLSWGNNWFIFRATSCLHCVMCAFVLTGCSHLVVAFRYRGAAGFELRSWHWSTGRFSRWSSRKCQFTSSPRSVTDSIRTRSLSWSNNFFIFGATCCVSPLMRVRFILASVCV